MARVEDKLIRSIEAQTWIDDAAVPVQRAVRSVLDRAPRLEAFLHGTWLGHPLHAALISFPIGAWATGVVLDGLELAGRRRYRRAADVVTAFGLATAGLAILPGLADWSLTQEGARRVGFVHASLNTVIAGLYAGSLAARARRRRRTGIALSMTAFSLAGVSAWIGGEIAYRYGVGVRPRIEGRPEAPPERTGTARTAEARP